MCFFYYKLCTEGNYTYFHTKSKNFCEHGITRDLIFSETNAVMLINFFFKLRLKFMKLNFME